MRVRDDLHNQDFRTYAIAPRSALSIRPPNPLLPAKVGVAYPEFQYFYGEGGDGSYSFELTGEFLERLESLLDLLLPAYVNEGKSVLTIAFGCTGGRHRSVSITERLAGWLRGRGTEPRIRHRDVTK